MSNRQKSLEILVYGTGAVGATLAWRLESSGKCRITAVCRSNFQKVQSSGFRISTRLWGCQEYKPSSVINDVRSISSSRFDYIVYATKNLRSSVEEALDVTSHMATQETAIVTVQNGMHPHKPFAEAFPNNTILTGVCYLSCSQVTPGQIHQTSHIRPHAFHVGISHSPSVIDGTKKLGEFVSLDGSLLAVDNIHLEQWIKLMINVAFNSSTALMNADTREILVSPSGEALVRRLATECLQLGLGLGYDIPPDIVNRIIRDFRSAPPVVTSMLQDMRAGRALELEAFLGSCFRKSLELRTPSETMQMVYHALRAKERTRNLTDAKCAMEMDTAQIPR